MNLNFITVKEYEINGVPHEAQRAVIEKQNYHFWIIWKGLSPEDKLKLSISKEMIGEKLEWVCYRVRRKNTTVYKALASSYKLRRTDKLLPYQPRAVSGLCEALMRHGGALDSSDTGLGKTYTALAVCRELGLRPGVICKKAGIAGWKRGCSFMNIDPHFIINWDLAKNGKFPFASRAQHPYAKEWIFRWNVPSKCLLIFDEVHVANHSDSINYALYTASQGHLSLSMSATLADRPDRLKAFYKVLGIKTPEEFDAWLKEQGYFYNVSALRGESLSDVQDLVEISKTLFPEYGYRLTYEDKDVKAYFPRAVYQTEIISMSEKAQLKQNAMYELMIEKVEYYKNLGKNAEAIVANTRYRQAAELLKCDALVELALEYLYEGRSVLIYVNYRETLAYLSTALRTRSVIYGEQEKDHINREEVISEFQKGKKRLIVCMVEAGGTSIDLHDTVGNHPRISLICPTYNAVTLKQVLGRTYRAGSKTIPIMKLVYAAGTIEEKVAEAVNRKLANISALNDGDLMVENFFGIKSSS